ncbi:hypothetical protein DYB32_007639 [Aphanomyces invadans]|uniref:RmlD-like substrate binding domain-containing protein n=1 Tax=Aphanomyces invadans TaxID=157072 RepID=A0A418ANF7_9STRA|nr:hypothetical protein DYB32_007639 [Aphanomyces invadans]
MGKPDLMCMHDSDEHKAAFASDIVEYVQADLTRDSHVDRAFRVEAGPYDYVFNLAGETKCSQAESVYSSKSPYSLDATPFLVNLAKKALEVHVKMFVEVSTAYVYKSQTKAPATENAKLDPWTLQAKYKLQAHGVTNTPLSPFIDRELLCHNQLYVDGSKIEGTGFTYDYPHVRHGAVRETASPDASRQLRVDHVRAIVQDAINQRIFPPVLA